MEVKNKLKDFIENKFSRFIFKFKYVFLAIGLLFTCFNTFSLTQMEVSNTPEKVLKSSNPFQKAFDWS